MKSDQIPLLVSTAQLATAHSQATVVANSVKVLALLLTSNHN